MGDAGTATSVEGDKADLETARKFTHHKGTAGQKHSSRTDLTETGESIPIPDLQVLRLLGFVHCLFVVMAFLFL